MRNGRFYLLCSVDQLSQIGELSLSQVLNVDLWLLGDEEAHVPELDLRGRGPDNFSSHPLQN